MGLNVGSIYSANKIKPVIDEQALSRVSEKILNPNNDKTVDLTKLDLSKFNRVKLGTDLYNPRTSTETVLKTAKALTDFDINFSKAFSLNVQYLNSQAAQSLFTSKENNGKLVLNTDNINHNPETQVLHEASFVSEMQSMNKDKRGSNPFSFYLPNEAEDDKQTSDSNLSNINIFA